MKKTITIVALVIVLAIVSYAVSTASRRYQAETPRSEASSPLTLEEYFKENISTLSPIKETLGGKFYITKLEAHGGAGTVYYEDGHSAYVADFTYSVDEKGYTRVETFNIRK